MSRLTVTSSLLTALLVAAACEKPPNESVIGVSQQFAVRGDSLYASAVRAVKWEATEHELAMDSAMLAAEPAMDLGIDSVIIAAYQACIAAVQRNGLDVANCDQVLDPDAGVHTGYGSINNLQSGVCTEQVAPEAEQDPCNDPPFGWEWDYFEAIRTGYGEWMTAADYDAYLKNIEIAALYNEGSANSEQVFAVAAIARSSAYQWEACDWSCLGITDPEGTVTMQRATEFCHRCIAWDDIGGAVGGALVGGALGGAHGAALGALGGAIGGSTSGLVKEVSKWFGGV